MEYGLWYPKGQYFTLKAFTNANWVGSADDRNITSGAAFFMRNCVV